MVLRKQVIRGYHFNAHAFLKCRLLKLFFFPGISTTYTLMKLDLNAKYCLILIDIIRSSKLNEETREILFADLGKRLEDLNRNLSPAPVLKLSINYGDEIAGLFSTPVSFYSIVENLRRLFPGKKSFRFVACTGKIGFMSEDITQVGGEVFKHAGELMAQLKKTNHFVNGPLKILFSTRL